MSKVINIIIATNHECVRAYLQKLKDSGDINLPGVAKNGRELLQMTKELLPSIIIADCKMYAGAGDTITQIIKTYPQVAVIVYSENDSCGFINKVIKDGAKGFVLKTAPWQEILVAVQSVSQGMQYTCAHTIKRLEEYKRAAKLRSNTVIVPHFTAKEKEVILYIIEEMTDKEIAVKMQISIRTVHCHKDKIRGKLGAKNNNEIRKYARLHGLA